jgi:16S rRNA (guanine1207-N2)-methyltransferase
MRIKANLRGKDYVFETKSGLFSKNEIDPGSQLLIENMVVIPEDVVLDLGCGYGPIGLVAADLANRGKVYMVDTDIRAIKYSKINADLNNIHNVEIKASDGFEDLEDTRFNVVLSNPPSHSTNETIVEFIQGSRRRLKQGGVLYFVTEKRMQPFIKKEFKKAFDNYQEHAARRQWVVSIATK